MLPESLLPVLLSRYFPVISGPEDLPLVAGLLENTHSEFCACLRTDPEMVACTCRSGFLPMSEDFTGHDVLLVKSHEQRCLLEPGGLHVSRSTRRRARGLTVRIDHDFDSCLAAIVDHHPERWLTDRLCDSLRSLHRKPRSGVKARSVEVYSGAVLVAGEIGYTCGAAYTSMSGFHSASGAGSVQLAALGTLLEQAGFSFWDLGMVIEYKIDLGSRVYEREAFLERYSEAGRRPTPDLSRSAACDELLDRRYSSTG
ncbi:MAG: leucyl/phenylalanyl-tRNA--protein transferase [Spirochaetota bacterium]